MASQYPTTVDVETPLVDGTDYVEADNVNVSYLDISSVQTFVGASGAAQSHNTDILTQLANFKAPILQYNSSSSFDVLAGSVVTQNSGGSIKKLRRNTATVNVTSANLDTGAMAVGYYYVYAVGDAAATTFTVKFSTSSSAPTGVTHYALIGWFYNETGAVLDITNKQLGNYRGYGRDVHNYVVKHGTTADAINDTSYGTDMTEASIRFYSTGRPVMVLFNLAGTMSTGMSLDLILDLDGSDESNSETKWGGTGTSVRSGCQLTYIFTPSAGTHTYTIQAKVDVGTYTVIAKKLQVIEL